MIKGSIPAARAAVPLHDHFVAIGADVAHGWPDRAGNFFAQRLHRAFDKFALAHVGARDWRAADHGPMNIVSQQIKHGIALTTSPRGKSVLHYFLVFSGAHRSVPPFSVFPSFVSPAALW